MAFEQKSLYVTFILRRMNAFSVKLYPFLLVLIVWSGNLFAQEPVLKPARNFQLSLLPMLGTEGTSVLHHRYHMSVNLFAGITGGIEGLEMGGFMNLTNGTVEGLQLAGFGNIVNGPLRGAQGAGFMNIVNGPAKGLMGSGFLNVVRGGHEGVMGAGFLNVSADAASGVSGAGFMNITRGSFKGVTGSGFMNVTEGGFEGIAGTGFMNVVGSDAQGLMGAGFANIVSGNMKGPQIAGFMNVSGNLEGIQVSGFLNIAQKVKGTQIGFINICDTIEGVPVGFLSIVRKGGLRQFELGASDALFLNAAFRIGVDRFYNIFSMGYHPQSNSEFWGYGYGIGTQKWLSETASMGFEVQQTNLVKNWSWSEFEQNYLYEFRLLAALNLNSSLQLFAGAVLYNQHFKLKEGESAEDYNIAPWTFHQGSYRNWHSQWWLGARGGARVLLR